MALSQRSKDSSNNNETDDYDSDAERPLYEIDECIERIRTLIERNTPQLSDSTLAMLQQIEHSLQYSLTKSTDRIKELEEENGNLYVELNSRLTHRECKSLVYQNNSMAKRLRELRHELIQIDTTPIPKPSQTEAAEPEKSSTIAYDKAIALVCVYDEQVYWNGSMLQAQDHSKIGPLAVQILIQACEAVDVHRVADLIEYLRSMRRLIKTLPDHYDFADQVERCVAKAEVSD